MTWVESVSPSFTARFESDDETEVAAVVEELERLRERLDDALGATPGEVTFVFHPDATRLDLARPQLALARRLTAPAGRRYRAGWAGRDDVHVLAPRALRARAANLDESRELLAREPLALYATLAATRLAGALPPPWTPARVARAMRWAWLTEGAGRVLSGWLEHARPAIGRRLREGSRPAFPPVYGDSTLLGPTLVDLLRRERGTEAIAPLLRDGPVRPAQDALRAAFDTRSVEDRWRSHLERIAGR